MRVVGGPRDGQIIHTGLDRLRVPVCPREPIVFDQNRGEETSRSYEVCDYERMSIKGRERTFDILVPSPVDPDVAIASLITNYVPKRGKTECEELIAKLQNAIRYSKYADHQTSQAIIQSVITILAKG